jgi:Periplasmic binding protein
MPAKSRVETAIIEGSWSVARRCSRPRPAKGKIPDTPLKTGHMTFLTSPAAVIGEPSLKGHIMAAEEINAQGGQLGKRKIETITADEAAGTDACVKELRRMRLDAKIDVFTGVISSGTSPAVGPVAEELELLSIFTDDVAGTYCVVRAHAGPCDGRRHHDLPRYDPPPLPLRCRGLLANLGAHALEDRRVGPCNYH